MPITKRPLADFIDESTGLFKDNTAKDISAQELRDFCSSTWVPYITGVSTSNANPIHGDYLLLETTGIPIIIVPGSNVNNDRIGIRYHAQGATTDYISIQASVNGTNPYNLYVPKDDIIIQYDNSNSNWIVIQDNIIAHKSKIWGIGTPTVPNNTETLIDFSAINFEVGNLADIGTQRITIKRAGIYNVMAALGIGINSTTGTIFSIRLKVNGVQVRESDTYLYAPDNNGAFMQISEFLQLNASDYLQLYVFHKNGTSQDVSMSFLSVEERR